MATTGWLDLAAKRPRGSAVGARATTRALRPLTQPPRLGFGRAEHIRWRILHSIPLDDYGVTLDHLLIGPTGLFAITSGNHPGKTLWVGTDGIKIDGQMTGYASMAEDRARRADDLLAAADPDTPATIWPVVAIAGAMVTGRPATASGVLVSGVGTLARDLSGYPRILSDEQVDAVYDIARRSDTWTSAHPDLRRQA